MYANGCSFANQDMFVCYAGIGVGHDAVLSERHPHGLVDEDIPADNEVDEIGVTKDPELSHMSWNDRDVDGEEEDEQAEEDEDEADEGRDSSGDDASDDSDFEAYF